MLGGNLGSLLYGDVPVMSTMKPGNSRLSKNLTSCEFIVAFGKYKKKINIAKSEQSSHTPGGSHQRPYHFN